MKNLPNVEKLRPDLLPKCPDAKEGIDPKFCEAIGRELEITFLVDSDHAHNRRHRDQSLEWYDLVGQH